MKRYLCCTAFVAYALSLSAQTDSLPVSSFDTMLAKKPASTSAIKKGHYGKVYKLKPAIDIPVFLAGAGWSAYAFTKIYSKKRSSVDKILGLDKSDINGFDRWAVRPHSEKAGNTSDYFFYGSMPLPFLFLALKDPRKDFFKITFLYLEAMSITGLLYTGSVYLTDRFRPYTYSDETPLAWRTRGGAKNSFFAGHVALVATSTFFTAKVLADYNPDSKIKWLFYGLAGAATGTVAYLRYRGGFHFPSDIILGMAQGTLTGILVPHFHKNKPIKNQKLGLLPYSNGEAKGITLLYRF